MEKIKFSHDEEKASEVVRSILFNMLKDEKISQIPQGTEGFMNWVEFDGNIGIARTRFLLLVNEILWELIIQRVITPGLNMANPNLPWFRLTEYGKKVVQEGRFLPHDTSKYLDDFKSYVLYVNPTVMIYLEESLRCFVSGCFIASAMMLGIASEVSFLELCKKMLKSLKDKKEKSDFRKIMETPSMIKKFVFVRDKIEAILKIKKHKGKLPEDAIVALLGVFDLIRRQRNDIGHPQKEMPALSRDQVFVFLQMFPHYCKTVQGVEQFLKSKRI